MSFQDFLEYLLKSRKLRRLEFPFSQRKEVRYTWGSVPLEVVLLTLKQGIHFSHFTAVQLHDLTEQDPRTLYVNHEQPRKPIPQLGLAQERIDLAFRRKPRVTRNIAVVKGARRKGTRVCLLNGKHSGYLGVEEREIHPRDEGEAVRLRLTDVERTLIDIAVRPFYAGGVPEVLKAYERAADRVSVNRLAAMLRKLDYVYPYHQAIGFYLEAAGSYEGSALEFFHGRFGYQFDFYLTYGMKETEYVPRWRIHVPKGLNRPGR
ncbi:MAG: type IV toxin-antitoxin system AbiEi family antitoxin [Phycisphaerae bacterium]